MPKHLLKEPSNKSIPAFSAITPNPWLPMTEKVNVSSTIKDDFVRSFIWMSSSSDVTFPFLREIECVESIGFSSSDVILEKRYGSDS